MYAKIENNKIVTLDSADRDGETGWVASELAFPVPPANNARTKTRVEKPYWRSL